MKEVDKTLIGTVIYFFMVVLYRLQSFAGLIVWFFGICPFLLIFRNKDRQGERGFKYIFDLEKFSHRIFFPIFKKLLAFHSFLTGIVTGSQMYRRLVTWDKTFPVIAFHGHTTKFSAKWLGKKEAPDSQTRPADFIFFNGTEHSDRMQIIEKLLSAKGDRLHIRAVWISGQYAGQVFELSPAFQTKLWGSGRIEHFPYSIYEPPGVFVLLLQAVFYFGIWESLKVVWELVRPILVN